MTITTAFVKGKMILTVCLSSMTLIANNKQKVRHLVILCMSNVTRGCLHRYL